MVTETAVKTNYPVISVAAWRVLRKKFQDNPPKGAVNASYLSTVLDYKPDVAPGLLGQLKRVGLIDNDEGRLTDRAYKWRDDKQYREVCQEILDEVYPQELRDLFHSPNAPRSEIERWFRNTTKSGAGTASNYARFYTMLLDGDPTKLDTTSVSKPAKGNRTAKEAPRSPKAKGNGSPTASDKSAEPTMKESEQTSLQDQPHQHATGSKPSTHTFAPTLHLDIQIHIAPEMQPDQIDQIFASMAKHLRILMVEAGE